MTALVSFLIIVFFVHSASFGGAKFAEQMVVLHGQCTTQFDYKHRDMEVYEYHGTVMNSISWILIPVCTHYDVYTTSKKEHVYGPISTFNFLADLTFTGLSNSTYAVVIMNPIIHFDEEGLFTIFESYANAKHPPTDICAHFTHWFVNPPKGSKNAIMSRATITSPGHCKDKGN